MNGEDDIEALEEVEQEQVTPEAVVRLVWVVPKVPGMV